MQVARGASMRMIICSLLMLLFTLQPVPAPHITTWETINFKAGALKDSYKQAKCCGNNGAGCSVNVPLNSSTINAPTAGLETHKFWQNVNGLWDGDLSYAPASPDKNFPGDYKAYHGLIWRRAQGNKYFQKNIFFYKHDPNWAVSESVCRSNNTQCTSGVIGKNLGFGYGFFTCNGRYGGGTAGAVKIFSEVHSKQSLDGVSLVPDTTAQRTCTDTSQFTTALEGSDTALAACGSTTTQGYNHGQIISIRESDNTMFRAWLDTAGSHSYYKEKRVGTTLGSSSSSNGVASRIRVKLDAVGFKTTSIQTKILQAITGSDATGTGLDKEVVQWLDGKSSTSNALDACSSRAFCLGDISS